jgi:hypothetical protein
VDVGANDGLVWRLSKYGQGSLPGLAVGDDVVIDVAGGEYAFTKPEGGRVATLPVSSSRLEKHPCCTRLSDGSIRYDIPSQDMPWVTLSNRTDRVSVTFNPAPKEALLDPALQMWMKERSLATSARK